MAEAVTVRCTSGGRGCGWRGRRVQRECCCYDEWALYCNCAWGRCPRCERPVYPVAYLREQAANQRRTDAWVKEHFGA